MKRALITGATGFVGRHLAKRLISDGWRVTAIVRPESKKVRISGVSFVVHDGTTESMIALVKKARPDVVFHVASLFISEHTPAQVRPLIESNLLFATQLTEAMTQCGALRLVNTGTSWQHYRNADYDPVNLYAATKQAFEDVLAYYRGARGLHTITLKLFDTYGADDPRPKLISALQRAHKERFAFSPGAQHIDLVHIDDVIEAFAIAASRLLAGKVQRAETYAISSGRPLPLRRMVGIFEKIGKRKLLIDWGARPYRSREVMRTWSRGNRLPGWQPRISLKAGLARLNS